MAIAFRIYHDFIIYNLSSYWPYIRDRLNVIVSYVAFFIKTFFKRFIIAL